MRLCIIARADLTGLGIQSRNWVRLLNPQKLVVINSTMFNRNEQHLEWYSGRGGYIIDGFIKPNEIIPILNNVDVLLTFEIPYSYELFRIARQRGVKTILQNNWEFTDYLKTPELPLPDIMMNHSLWHLQDQKKLWPNITEYCPTPVFIEDYDKIMLHNMDRDVTKRRFLHIAGRRTYEDRNGTLDLIEAIKKIPKNIDFELVFKTQSTEIPDFDDPRVKIDLSVPLDEKELYRDFDALILPRRYGGACLPMNEALTAGMPVIMTDIDPNNKILPKDWLVKSKPAGQFMTRAMIDLYSADHNALADRIVDFALKHENELIADKIRSREIACDNYSSEVVKEKFTGLLTKLGV